MLSGSRSSHIFTPASLAKVSQPVFVVYGEADERDYVPVASSRYFCGICAPGSGTMWAVRGDGTTD
jgi:pimeloyl-ACP methyl ester carboxylesterase